MGGLGSWKQLIRAVIVPANDKFGYTIKKIGTRNQTKSCTKEVETWWRLEMQLRRGKATDWHNMVQRKFE